MKNIFKITILFVGILGISSCEKEILDSMKEPYLATNLDEKAGAWKTYIISSGNQLMIDVPKLSTDAAYLKEVDSLKTQVLPNLSNSQKEAISYWGAGAVYRWNEIARELSAKYNLPPAANAEGKYPVPDAANPTVYPYFPFANPPYVSRALAYLSVAQYDALVSAWNYKYKYNRKAPSKIDTQIKTLLPVSDLPSYPSENAVVAGASYVVLAAMFPGEIQYLESKLVECKNVGLWAGLNVNSDIVAGEKLGRAVAVAVMTRAKTDGMSSSNNQALTADMITAAKNRGIVDTWISQESPIRPPMLPNFGAVQTWNFDRVTLQKIRPQMPYIVGSAEWKKEFDELAKINKSQTREQARIANFWADGAGSYTPPGHWHRMAANAGFDAKFSEVRMARTLAMVGTSLMDAAIGCWETKYYYYTPRPQQFGLKTSVGLPNFPSYTSGHSTFSAAAATVLGYIFPEKATQFEAKAKEASESRIYGLIHYRSDCEMGLIHGKKIGEFAISRGKADGSGL